MRPSGTWGGAAVLDFLFITDAGRLVPAEEDAGSEASEWETWERREGLMARVRNSLCSSPLPPSWRPSAEEE